MILGSPHIQQRRPPVLLLLLPAVLLVAACGEGPPFDDAGPQDAGTWADGLPTDGSGPPPDSAQDGAPDDTGKKPHDLFAPDSAPPPPPAKAFSVALLPDTQYYTQSSKRAAIFSAQTAWIVKQLKTRPIAFVSHVGDIVQSGAKGSAKNKAQWDRAVKAMAALDGDLKAKPDGLVPYAAVAGNHDLDTPSNKTKGATQYLKYFGPWRYKGRSWFLGASTNGQNMAQRFTGGGRTYLHLGLEWRPSDSAIAWAQGVLAKYPSLPTIISTHQYLGKGNPASRMTTAETPDGSGVNNGESLYRKLVVPYPQVFLVLCGHVPGVGRRADKTALGRTVHQVLADYQHDQNGGNGWLQVIRFDPVARKLSFAPLSPTYVPGTTSGTDHSKSAASNFSLTFDLAAHRSHLTTARVARFRQGQDSYLGALDTHLGDGGGGGTSPKTAHGAAKDVLVDGDQANEQGLLRFGGVFGKGPGKVPMGSKIKKAILTVTTEGKYADSKSGARFYRMKVVWSESSTWNSLGKGVQLGAEAEKIHDADSAGKVGSKGTRSLDVTTSVQAWSDGKQNHGWVLINNGTDRWQFRSSQWTAVAERPMLTVVY